MRLQRRSVAHAWGRVAGIAALSVVLLRLVVAIVGALGRGAQQAARNPDRSSAAGSSPAPHSTSQSPPSTSANHATPPEAQQPPPAEAPAAPRTGERGVVVDPAGAGDFRSLEEALQQVPPRTLLRLADGVHRLASPLVIDKPLRLEGAGRDTTHVVCAAPGFVVRIAGDIRLEARGITFRHEGEQPANVMEVRCFLIELHDCAFEGGQADDERNRAAIAAGKWGDTVGHGLVLRGTARGLVRGCVAQGNGACGVLLAEQAQPTLERNTCRQNKHRGIAYFGSASGTARNNTCEENDYYGIYVGGQAQPTLEQNTCRQNKWSGIAYFGSASGTARDNTCEGNEYHGIQVAEQAQPTLEQNTCRQNKQCGIAYFGSATGTARHNTCEENDYYGIYVGEQAQPTLEQNTCRQNEKCGIAYFGSASGTARNNTCEGNEYHGIYVAGQAQPTLERNALQGNGDFRLFVEPGARPVIRQ
jgi:parallel beta-helix repeat protein